MILEHPSPTPVEVVGPTGLLQHCTTPFDQRVLSTSPGPDEAVGTACRAVNLETGSSHLHPQVTSPVGDTDLKQVDIYRAEGENRVGVACTTELGKNP